MAVLRMDHVVVVVPELDPAIAFFEELGLELEARMPGLKGDWIDRVNAIDGVDVEIAMLVTPDGHSKLELTQFHAPAVNDPGLLPASTMGLRSVMFTVDDVDGTVERLRPFGGELIGEIVSFEDVYRLCYVRGPGDAIVALAQEL
jgi:catechol 2,3-dioxygenase-like lactoylglutathione lyase family enzyme